MLHQEAARYSPTPLSSTGEHDVVATPANSVLSAVGSGSRMPAARQPFSQQQLLRQSLSSRSSYVAGMRNVTAYTASGGGDAANVSRSQPLIPACSTLPADAEGVTGADDAEANYEVDLVTTPRGTVSQPSLMPPLHDNALTAVGEDFVHEVLAMNTMAMEQCYAALGGGAPSAMAAATEEPMKILREAFMRLDDTSAQDLPGSLLDQLKATTLNNMGVVECNRGQPRQALSHFEAARQLEENNDMVSPSVALNTCAAYNALHMYDKATAAALETIEMLRALEAQRQRSRRIAAAMPQKGAPDAQLRSTNAATSGRGKKAAHDEAELDDTLLLEAASAPQIAESQSAALWGAAWNNLAVAQINTAHEAASKDTSEYTNTLTLFQNAMRATRELLGPQHPMSKAVVETFRSVRLALRNHGAFKQHRTLLRAPLPPVDPREQAWEEEQVEPAPGQSRHNALVKQRQQLTITFRGDVTGGQKLIERVDGTPYPGAVMEAYQSRRGASGGNNNGNSSSGRRKGKRTASSKQKAFNGSNSALRCMPHSETLTRASVVYSNPHPLLYTPPPAITQYQQNESPVPSLPGSARPPPRRSEMDVNRDDVGAASRRGNSARPSRPSPPLQLRQRPPQQPQRIQREQNSASVRSGAHSSRSSVLPPIAQGKKYDYVHEEDAESTNSVFMHVPPPVPPRYESPGAVAAAAAAAESLHHSKMLLLASPSPANAPSSDPSGVYTPAGSSYRAAQVGEGPLASFGDNGELRTENAAARDSEKPSHELFQGMWVTADAHYVHRGPRVFGRPIYYTISTTLDVDENGVTGSPPTKTIYENISGNDAALDPMNAAVPLTLTHNNSSDDVGDAEHSRSSRQHSSRSSHSTEVGEDHAEREM